MFEYNIITLNTYVFLITFEPQNWIIARQTSGLSPHQKEPFQNDSETLLVSQEENKQKFWRKWKNKQPEQQITLQTVTDRKTESNFGSANESLIY